jgi:putative membrane protein
MKHSNDKIRKKIIKTVGVTTAIAILIPTVTMGDGVETVAAATEGNVTKSESVYVNVDSTGKTEKEIVSNWLHDSTSGAVIADRSQLSDIANVKGEEEPQISGNNITWTLSGNDLYYQGKTEKQLPVSMTLQYFLDGESISPSELAGKSGKFELKISFKNNDAHSVTIGGRIKTVYTPFACVAAFNLPQKNFTNVTTNFGNVISDGNNQAVSFLGFPGLKQNFDMIDLSSVNLPDELDVTADVKDFSLGSIMMVATPVPDLDSLKSAGDDLNNISDKLSQLIDAGTQLKDATGTLNSGEKAFADGVRQLFDGVSTAGASFDKIVNGAGTLNSAVSNSKKGIPALVDGADSLASGAGQVSGGLDQLYAQFGTGTSESPTLKDSIGSLDGGAKQLAGGLGQLFAQFSTAESGQSATLYDSVNALDSGTSQYTALANSALFGMVETNLQTLQGALSSAMTSALTAQGMSEKQITAAVQTATTTAVTQEITGLHGAADAAVIGYLTAGTASEKAAYYNNACEYINLYDVLNIIAGDPDVVSLTDETKKEAAFELAMKSAAGTPSSYLYSFNKDSLSTTLATLSLTAEQKAALKAAASSISDSNISTAVNSINGNNIVLVGTGLSSGTSALAAQFKSAVSGESATLYDSINALNTGAQKLKDGTGALEAQTVTSGDASNPSLYDSISALDSGAKLLAPGAKTLASGASKLGSLQSGISSLYTALNLFRNGLSTIEDGTSELNGNSSKLVDGTTALDSGMSQFWTQGLGKLQSVDTDKIEQALQVKNEMIKLAKDYTTFTGSGDGITSNVKFILKTDEIKVSEKTAAQASGSSSAKSTTIWQKIGNWFKGLFHANT